MVRVHSSKDDSETLLACVHAKSLLLHLTLCDPMDHSPPVRLLCPLDSPGKNTEVGLPFPPLGDFPSTGIEVVSLKSPALAGRFPGASWEVVPCMPHVSHCN